MVDRVEGEWTLMAVGAGVVVARTAIEVGVETVGADWEKLRLRSTGVAEEAACMVYLAISKLQTTQDKAAWQTGQGMGKEKEGGGETRKLRRWGGWKEGEEWAKTKERWGERKEKQ